MDPEHNGNMPLHRVIRQFQTGLLLSSNLPPMWLAALTEDGTTLKVLVDWCVHTEEQMYLASRSSEEYYRLVQETVAGAIQVDTEFKREYNAVGIVTPERKCHFQDDLDSESFRSCFPCLPISVSVDA